MPNKRHSLYKMNGKYIMSRYFELVKDKYRTSTGEVILPKRATKSSVAYDFYSPIDITIPPMTSVMIWTDIKAKFNENEALLINIRSSMGKQPVMIANTQGWIDSDYYSNPDNDGNIGIRLFNLGNTSYVVKSGDRIAQGMFVKYLVADNGNTDCVRKSGFGSSGR